jgi:hypothetical protein
MMKEAGLRRFFAAFGATWFTMMSGPLTVPFTVAAIFFDQIWLKLLLGVLALVCAFAASFSVWRRERLAFLTEIGRNGKPEIRVKIVEGTAERLQATFTGYRGDPPRLVEEFSVLITLVITLLNVRPHPCSADRCSLKVNTPKRNPEIKAFSKATPIELMGLKIAAPHGIPEMEINLPLRQGVGATRYVRFLAEVWKDDHFANDALLILAIEDSFEGHWTTSIPASALRFAGNKPLED